jgi:hypothetical protein
MKYDIIITSCEKDKNVLQKCIQSIKQYIKGYRRIIVVSDNKLTDIENIEWFDEKNYPFSKKDLYDEMYNVVPDSLRRKRLGYINQLLKLYAHYIIPDLTENLLIIDSDVIFIKESSFFDTDDNKLIPKYGYNYMYPNGWKMYQNHFKKLHPDFKNFNKSGICHHIIYNKYIIEELFNRIEKYHKAIFWKIYLNLMDTRPNQTHAEPANCELYFNYINVFHKDKFILRKIKWMESPANGGQNNIVNSDKIELQKQTEIAHKNDCNYIAFHSYDRDLSF